MRKEKFGLIAFLLLEMHQQPSSAAVEIKNQFHSLSISARAFVVIKAVTTSKCSLSNENSFSFRKL